MVNLIIEYTSEGFQFAIAGTPKAISCVVTKEAGGRLYSESFVVDRKVASEKMVSLIVKAVDSISEKMGANNKDDCINGLDA